MKQYFVHCEKQHRDDVQKVANIIYTPKLVDNFVIVETDEPAKLLTVKGVTRYEKADTFRLSGH